MRAIFSFILSVLVLTIGISNSWATTGLEYPELSVVPRASERLKLESQKEEESKWLRLIPFQSSALSTFIAGVVIRGNPTPGLTGQDLDDHRASGTVAMATGGVWIASSLFLTLTYTPYQSGWIEVNNVNKSTKREELTYERFSEEALSAPAGLIRTLKWLSFVTNLGASAFLLGAADSDSLFLAGISAGLAFYPLLFESHWENLWEQHQEYKKRIYGPVASLRLLKANDKLIPGFGISYSF